MPAQVVLNTIFLPAKGKAAPLPAPYLLTEAELIRFTRLDETGGERPERTLAYYRKQGSLRAVQVGRELRYTLPDAIDFLEKLKELNPR